MKTASHISTMFSLVYRKGKDKHGYAEYFSPRQKSWVKSSMLNSSLCNPEFFKSI